MEVELITDGTWINSKLMIDGTMIEGIKKLSIFIGDKEKAKIEVNKPTSGMIPFGSLATVRGFKLKADALGKFVRLGAEFESEKFEYKNVNIIKAPVA